MVLAMKNGEMGRLVWVQRKNGTWWPGKIQISSLTSTSKVAVQLLRKENGPVEWFSLNSERIKAFRSIEFNKLIKSAESSKPSEFKKRGEYASREDAVLHAFLLEKQEQEKGLKRPANGEQEAPGRVKRSRFVYLPVEPNNNVEHSILHSGSPKGSSSPCATKENSHKSSFDEKTASGESTVFDSSETSSEDSDGDGGSQHTGSYLSGRQTRSSNAQKESISNSSKSSLDNKLADGAGAQDWNLKENHYRQASSGTPDTLTNEESSLVSRKQECCTQHIPVPDANSKEKRRHGFDNKFLGHLPLEVNMLSNSTSGDNSLEDSDSGSLCCGSVYSNLQNTMETLLVEVDVSAQAKYQRAQVPIVSLMSKANKIAIIGHPVEVETLEDVSEVLLVKKDSDDHVVANCGRKMHPLVWKTTYKRTPVCYITNLNSSASSYPGPGAKKNDVPQTNESLLKPLTKGSFSQNNGHDLRIVRQSSEKESKKKGGCQLDKGNCVPVNLIITKLFSAIGI